MKKKNNNVTNWRNEKKDIFAILGDNKKFLMPAILAVAVVLTVVIAVSANHRATEIAESTATEAESTVFEVPDVAMEENTSPEINALVEKYYAASASGDAETLAAIYKGLDETEILKAVAASEYIESIDNITVYTKPGPVEGSYVAYVYNEVKLYDYEGRVPGLEILYICSDENGDLYINGDVVDAGELDYLKQINVQADVIDLNNKVASSYNEMVSGDEALAELLTRMRSGLQVSVGEALATSETSTPEESAAEASSEEETDPGKVTVTTRIIKATDVINIRSSDSETADILDKTTKGQEFKELEALANGWSKVEYKGKEAYVKTEFFEVVSEETTVVDSGEEDNTDEEDEAASAASSASTESAAAASSESSTENQSKVSSAKTGKMTLTDSVKFRKGQSTDSEAITTIYAGSTVNVIEQYASGWAKIEYNNKTGYVKSEFLQD